MTRVKRVNPKLQKNKKRNIRKYLLKRTKKIFEITYLQTAIKPTAQVLQNKKKRNQKTLYLRRTKKKSFRR